ncbi:MAG TPA: phosphopantothenate/pantothenate synthetase [Thermoplasmata archaeon]|nr:phosphopantothenate/pantothenate synthetase [Thermoplasmata archaeon]
MRLSPRHPRYRSLRVRAGLAASARSGLVVPEGLIAHGRGEAFDYLLGERTQPSARKATRVAAAWIAAARRPVLSVNGNVAALAAREVAEVQRAWPALGIEVNLFHRTPRRVALVARALRRAGVRDLLGEHATGRIPGLPSDRARVDPAGIAVADVCVVPLEDGDRTRALRRLGKRVVAIDLNPLSRTSREASLPIVDELTRTLRHLASDLEKLRTAGRRPGAFAPFDAAAALSAAHAAIERNLRRAARARSPPSSPPARGARRPTRGTTRPNGRRH